MVCHSANTYCARDIPAAPAREESVAFEHLVEKWIEMHFMLYTGCDLITCWWVSGIAHHNLVLFDQRVCCSYLLLKVTYGVFIATTALHGLLSLVALGCALAFLLRKLLLGWLGQGSFFRCFADFELSHMSPQDTFLFLRIANELKQWGNCFRHEKFDLLILYLVLLTNFLSSCCACFTNATPTFVKEAIEAGELCVEERTDFSLVIIHWQRRHTFFIFNNK